MTRKIGKPSTVSPTRARRKAAVATGYAALENERLALNAAEGLITLGMRLSVRDRTHVVAALRALEQVSPLQRGLTARKGACVVCEAKA